MRIRSEGHEDNDYGKSAGGGPKPNFLQNHSKWLSNKVRVFLEGIERSDVTELRSG